jgi:hypothetical protein
MSVRKGILLDSFNDLSDAYFGSILASGPTVPSHVLTGVHARQTSGG